MTDAQTAAPAAMPAPAYSPREMMAIAAGRFIKDGDVLFAGTGVAMLAATVAKRIHAPHAHIFFETGGIGPLLDELPMAVADPRVMAFSNLNAGLVEAFLGETRLTAMHVEHRQPGQAHGYNSNHQNACLHECLLV